MKILILTESAGNPRSFPVEDMTELEETYPYLIREEYKHAVFWQLSYGNITTEELTSQACAYLTHWNPDLIIVHSGLNDCRPEAFTDFQKYIITNLSGRLAQYLKKYMYHPKLIKIRKIQRVSARRFRKTIKKLKLIFNDSNIIWLEISVDDSYDEIRPGVIRRMAKYNSILKEFYKDNVINLQAELSRENGFTTDKLHWNSTGHKLVARKLIEKINTLNIT